MSRYYISALFTLCCIGLQAQCDYTTLTVEIVTGFHPHELSWEVTDENGVFIDEKDLGDENVQDGEIVSWDVCLPDSTCAIFKIHDSYGDGIVPPGGFKLYLNGVLIVDDEFLDDFESRTINCGPGLSCLTADSIGVGEHTTVYDDHWYSFVPDTSGQFAITTCDLAICDTKIWLYTNCAGHEQSEDNTGTLAFDDNFGGCGEQANLITELEKDVTYFIRIGDDANDCADNFSWSLNFNGPIEGCTDIGSCNYNPLAVIDDGSCIPVGDPDCPAGPDLVIDQVAFETSIYLTNIVNSDPCLIDEGCLSGFGLRDVVQFTTRIANIGELDYYVGIPQENTDQFTFNNCHSHWHYDGYAEYLLFDETGQEIHVGFKNGFCVIDLGCDSGQQKYNCENMGITAGCYDEYWAGTECQWIDVTDVPDGDYTFVTRVNWDNAPDAQGRVEQDTANNWAQVCINIDRSAGQLAFTLLDDCPFYVDCQGTIFGSAQFDCEGNCAGPALQGDLNNDGMQDANDIQVYAEGVLIGGVAVNTCTDLSADGAIDILDLALFSDCLNFGNTHSHQSTGPHDHCQFGVDITAANDTVELMIAGGDPTEAYVDIAIRNPDSRVIAYQFSMSGINITHVESLTGPAGFNGQVMMEPLTKQVMAFVSDSTFLERESAYQPLVRVHHDFITDGMICLDTISTVVNEAVHRVPAVIAGECLSLTNVNASMFSELTFFPNPAEDELTISWTGKENIDAYALIDINGRVLSHNAVQTAKLFQVDLSRVPAGIYWVRLVGVGGSETVRFVKR